MQIKHTLTPQEKHLFEIVGGDGVLYAIEFSNLPSTRQLATFILDCTKKVLIENKYRNQELYESQKK